LQLQSVVLVLGQFEEKIRRKALPIPPNLLIESRSIYTVERREVGV
jgi:hypothetical protein